MCEIVAVYAAVCTSPLVTSRLLKQTYIRASGYVLDGRKISGGVDKSYVNYAWLSKELGNCITLIGRTY